MNMCANIQHCMKYNHPHSYSHSLHRHRFCTFQFHWFYLGLSISAALNARSQMVFTTTLVVWGVDCGVDAACTYNNIHGCRGIWAEERRISIEFPLENSIFVFNNEFWLLLQWCSHCAVLTTISMTYLNRTTIFVRKRPIDRYRKRGREKEKKRKRFSDVDERQRRGKWKKVIMIQWTKKLYCQSNVNGAIIEELYDATCNG